LIKFVKTRFVKLDLHSVADPDPASSFFTPKSAMAKKSGS